MSPDSGFLEHDDPNPGTLPSRQNASLPKEYPAGHVMPWKDRGRDRAPKASPGLDRMRGNVWLLAIGGCVIAGLLGGFVVGPKILDGVAPLATSPTVKSVDRCDQVIARQEIAAAWLSQSLFHLAQTIPPDSPALQSPEALRDHVREQRLTTARVAILVNSVMANGEAHPALMILDACQECPQLAGPFCRVMLAAVAGKADPSTHLGILSPDLVDDLGTLRLPSAEKSKIAQQLLGLVE
jgi:hypothetical protein